jgi:hypothetical protein
MPNPKRLLIVAALVALPAPLLAEIEIEGRFWAPSIDGTLRVQDGDLGTDIELPDQLGINDDEHFEIRFNWRLPGPAMLRFAYMPIEYGGVAEINEEIEFGGIVFPIDINVASQLELDYARFGFTWLFPIGPVKVGPLAEVKAVRAEAELTGSILSIPLVSAQEKKDAAFGSIGFLIDAQPVPVVHIFAEAAYSPGLDFGEMTEAELGVKFFPLEMLSVSGGYRFLQLDLEDDDDRLDVDLSGFFLAASLNF